MVMPLFLLSLGVALSVFLSTLRNATQVADVTGVRRAAHLLVVVLIVAILALLGLDGPIWPTRALGVALILATTWLFLIEHRAGLAPSLVQAAFGAIVAAGLPFLAA